MSGSAGSLPTSNLSSLTSCGHWHTTGFYCTFSASEMTYIVSSGALNSTHSLTAPRAAASSTRRFLERRFFPATSWNWSAGMLFPLAGEVVLDDLPAPPDRSQVANRPRVPCVETLWVGSQVARPPPAPCAVTLAVGSPEILAPLPPGTGGLGFVCLPYF